MRIEIRDKNDKYIYDKQKKYNIGLSNRLIRRK